MTRAGHAGHADAWTTRDYHIPGGPVDYTPDPMAALLPPLRPCDRLDVGPGEVLVNAPGFEERTFAAADRLRGADGARAILLRYVNPPDPSPTDRVAMMRARYAERGVTVADDDILPYSRFEPDAFSSRIRDRLCAAPTSAVVLDVSSMTRLAILVILDACQELNLPVRVFYGEANDYAPTEEEFNGARARAEPPPTVESLTDPLTAFQRPSLSIYTGLFGCVRIAALSSVAMQGQPTAAIAFMSFNEMLTQALLSSVYPSRLFLINGRPPVMSWREEATAWIHDRMRRDWEDDNPVDVRDGGRALPRRVTSTLLYAETVVELLGLYADLYVDHRILLAPTGSKMQTVACAIVRGMHPDIHIEYPTPRGYFKDYYSHGVERCWLVDFGRFGDLTAALRREENRQFLHAGA